MYWMSGVYSFFELNIFCVYLQQLRVVIINYGKNISTIDTIWLFRL